MKDIGRNEPCHCGSGKKYKKCCMVKDEENELKANYASRNDGHLWKNTDDDLHDQERSLLSEFPELSDDLSDNEYEEYLPEFDDSDEEFHDPFDDLTNEQSDTIDQWWDAFYELDDEPESIEKHIMGFLQNHADLAPFLEIAAEPLEILADKYLEADQFEKYIDFIRQLKTTYPDEILVAGGEIELDILTWLLAKNQLLAIPEFLNSFKDEAMDYAMQLPNAIHLFLLTNKADLILPVLNHIYQEICESEHLIQPYSVLHPVIANHIDQHFEHPDPAEMVRFLNDEILVEVNEDILKATFWEEYMASVKKPFNKWPESPPKDEMKAVALVRSICENYIGFLKERVGLHFASAEYMAMKVNHYLLEVLDAKSPATKLFNFEYKKMRKYAEQASRGGPWINYVGLMSVLNGLHYFADYLQECGSLLPEQTFKIKNDLAKIHQIHLRDNTGDVFEKMLFKDFPITY